MSEASDKLNLAEKRTDFSEYRTDFAEDRTLMANERTFAGWLRTGLASVGIGIGFNALFSKMEPDWLPRAIATCFIIAGLMIFYLAERNASAVLKRLDMHSIKPLNRMNLRLVAGVMALGSLSLLFGLWFLV